MNVLVGLIVGRLLILVTLPFVVFGGDEKTTFINFSEDPITIFWVDNVSDEGKEAEGNLRFEVGKINPYEAISQSTTLGHMFQYENDKVSGSIAIEGKDSIHPMGLQKTKTEKRRLGENVKENQSEILVTCFTTEGDIRMHVTPETSPFGAARFLYLIKHKYYDGCALNRVVDGFLTQFGISPDYDMRTEMRTRTIPDDFASETERVHFKPGYLSYAGSGPNSRSTEIFIVMHNTPQTQLDYFGPHTNPWETPFGYVELEDVENVVSKWYSGYGDMPSQGGSGPDPQMIYKKGGYDTYLKNEFPLMSYIHSCQTYSGVVQTKDDEEEL